MAMHRISKMEDLRSAFEKTVALYRDALEKADRSEEFDSGPWVVASGISRILFDAWLDTVPTVWKVAYEKEGGRVLLFGDPKTPHACTAGWLLKKFTSEIIKHFGDEVLESLDFSTDEDFDIHGYGVKVPDMSIIPHSRRNSIPAVVAEVGYRNERNFDVVQQEVLLWSQFGVPVVIGIKITDTPPLGSMEDPRIQVMVKQVGLDDQVFDLGEAPCTGRGTHVANVPSRLLLTRAQCSHAPNLDLEIDLFDLQKKISDWVNNH